jgi:DNA-binding NarL/FixJ family response regulator
VRHTTSAAIARSHSFSDAGPEPPFDHNATLSRKIRMPRIDLLPTLEACYRFDLPDQAWLEEVCQAVLPWLGAGLGAFAFTFDMPMGTNPRLFDPVVVGAPRADTMRLVTASRNLDPDALRQAYLRSGPVTTGRQATTTMNPSFAETLAAAGSTNISDFLVLIGASPDSTGILVGAACPQVRHLRRHEITWMARISSHLANAFRLRLSLQQQPADLLNAPQAEAIFHPSGRLAHSTPTETAKGLLAQLRASVLDRDRARSRASRLDSFDRLELWGALIAGRWSLIDSFDSDQRRFVVALRNPPQASQPRQLGRREAQVVGYVTLGWSNKAIAYAMGLSESTVGSHLWRACRKLGARDRISLIELARSLHCNAPASKPEGAAFDRPALSASPAMKLIELTPRLSTSLPKLTLAEQQILSAILQGLSNTEIAKFRDRDLSTVAKQVGSLLRKLGASSRAELVARVTDTSVT